MEMRGRIGLLLGVFTNPKEPMNKYFDLTQTAKLFDLNLKGYLTAQLITDGQFKNENKIKHFFSHDPTIHHYVSKYDRIAVVDLGPSCTPKGLEHVSIKIDNIMDGIVAAVRYFTTNHFDVIYIDSCDYPRIVGTAVALAFPLSIKSNSSDDPTLSVRFFDEFHLGGESEYEKGIFLGNGQKVAQHLTKSNSVSEFVKRVKSVFGEFNVKIKERTDSWMRKRNMNLLLSVAERSTEKPVILEIIYNNSKEEKKPLVVVGKATPYEKSFFPLSDKPELRHLNYRSGMGGGSCILGSVYVLCKLQAPAFVHCIIAVVWNQLCNKTDRKGIVVRAMNGTSIQIDNPEAESRLILADVFSYANSVNPSTIMDVATLSSNIDTLIGNSYICFFTSNENLKRILLEASQLSGEKIWQLPLYKCFRELLKVSSKADFSNVGADEKSATACKSASFLKEFINTSTPWIHLDISAVTECRGKKTYLTDCATGRSTRLIAEFCINFFLERKVDQ